MNNPIWLPFEIVPCSEHGMACGGVPKARHDLPVFTDMAKILPWMTAPENAAHHQRGGERVMLQWVEHTPEEAVNLGFPPPKQELH